VSSCFLRFLHKTTTPHETLYSAAWSTRSRAHLGRRPGGFVDSFSLQARFVSCFIERRRLASFAVTGNVSGVCLPASASDPLHCTTPSQAFDARGRQAYMHDTIQTALPSLSIPRWPSRPPIARFPLSFHWSSPRTVLAQRKNDIGP
jgi:hypothetical protein